MSTPQASAVVAPTTEGGKMDMANAAAVTKMSGGGVVLTPLPLVGGRRSRKGRKGRKGSKKTRKMRGGAGSISMGTVGHSFEGKGVAGLADHSQYTTQGNAF